MLSQVINRLLHSDSTGKNCPPKCLGPAGSKALYHLAKPKSLTVGITKGCEAEVGLGEEAGAELHPSQLGLHHRQASGYPASHWHAGPGR
jgi:hypothetical protein